ncbi:hypothetical protein Trydic_g14525 [Trypoxylus dichotomus]
MSPDVAHACYLVVSLQLRSLSRNREERKRRGLPYAFSVNGDEDLPKRDDRMHSPVTCRWKKSTRRDGTETGRTAELQRHSIGSRSIL